MSCLLSRLSYRSAGESHGCAIRREDQGLVCWGDDSQGQASPPEGRFASVAAGTYHSCAVRSDE